MWEIKRYFPDSSKDWDSFVDEARNSTFLFMRGYMDYHSDRYVDFSLMAYRRGSLAAVLPANISGSTLHSHQGLTYGGWILAPSGLDTTDLYRLWKEWFEFCRQEGIDTIIYKPLPYIYALMPSEEDLYLLYLSKARIIQTDISTCIDLARNPGFNKLQRRHLRKASKEVVVEVQDYYEIHKIDEFHSLLSNCLKERHAALPVHSLNELKVLMSRFRENILIWNAYDFDFDELLAAVCVYETPMCIHCQYIATSPRGRCMNALSFLFHEMISLYTDIYINGGPRYLDFGISNEDAGMKLNSGLNRQKTSYGGSGVAYQRYEIDVKTALQKLPDTLWP